MCVCVGWCRSASSLFVVATPSGSTSAPATDGTATGEGQLAKETLETRHATPRHGQVDVVRRRTYANNAASASSHALPSLRHATFNDVKHCRHITRPTDCIYKQIYMFNEMFQKTLRVNYHYQCPMSQRGRTSDIISVITRMYS